MSFVWSEKYRPKSFDDMIGQASTVQGVKALVEKGSLPHVLFTGPPGVGKSTLALVIAKKLFGSNWKENFLELNASDERGIDVVRNKVKDFARTKGFDAKFKVIFLDECDALTREAQQALRRTMENFTNSCRFILSCNYVARIIDPIQSRCVVYRFAPLAKQDIESLIDRIAQSESLQVDQGAKDALFEASAGDCRRAVNLLQACADSPKITKDSVNKLARLAQVQGIPALLALALKGDIVGAKKQIVDMLAQGISATELIKQVDQQAATLATPDAIRITQYCGDCEFRLVQGSDELIQLGWLLAKIAQLRA